MAVNLKYSQNYLHNDSLVSYLISLSTINSQDQIIEIGPGKGIITTKLATKCRRILAIEKDLSLTIKLQKTLTKYKNVGLIGRDFLTFDLPKDKYKVFSNIPFSLTAAIIKKLLSSKNPPTECYLIIQEDAIKKYAGQPYGQETMQSLLHKPWFSFQTLHTLKPSDFNPSPNVVTVFTKITKLTVPFINEKNSLLYRDFVAYGFTRYGPSLNKVFEQIFNPQEFDLLANRLLFTKESRPTDLTFEQWIGIFDYFVDINNPIKINKINGAHKDIERMQAGIVKQNRTRKY